MTNPATRPHGGMSRNQSVDLLIVLSILDFIKVFASEILKHKSNSFEVSGDILEKIKSKNINEDSFIEGIEGTRERTSESINNCWIGIESQVQSIYKHMEDLGFPLSSCQSFSLQADEKLFVHLKSLNQISEPMKGKESNVVDELRELEKISIKGGLPPNSKETATLLAELKDKLQDLRGTLTSRIYFASEDISRKNAGSLLSAITADIAGSEQPSIPLVVCYYREFTELFNLMSKVVDDAVGISSSKASPIPSTSIEAS